LANRVATAAGVINQCSSALFIGVNAMALNENPIDLRIT
jgi:hypothetical protein